MPGPAFDVYGSDGTRAGKLVGVTPQTVVHVWFAADDVVWSLSTLTGGVADPVKILIYADSTCTTPLLDGVGAGWGSLAKDPLRGPPTRAYVARGQAMELPQYYTRTDVSPGCVVNNSPAVALAVTVLDTIPSFTPPLLLQLTNSP